MALFEEAERKKQTGDALAWALLGQPAPDPGTAVAGQSYSGVAPSWLNAMAPRMASVMGQRPTAPDATEASGGWGGFDPAGLGGLYGSMSPNELSTLGMATRGVGLANLGIGLAATPTPAGMFASLVNLGIRGVESAFPNRERGYVGIAPTVMQDLVDMYGPGMTAPSLGQYGPGYGFGGWEGSYAGAYGGGGDGGASSGGESAGGSGMGGAGGVGGGGEARGGVRTARPGKERVSLYGEAGPETAIFIPAHMALPGLQGPEAQVKRSLRQALMALGG